MKQSQQQYYCLYWAVILFNVLMVYSNDPLNQCGSDVSITMARIYNSIFKDAAASYSMNASLYGKAVTFSFDSNTVQTSYTEAAAKLKRNQIAMAVAEVPPPPTTANINNAQNILAIPVFAGSLIFYFNLTNITHLILTPQVIADIYMGNIVDWNDESIQNLNPQLDLPRKKIIVTAEYAENAGTDLLGWSLSIFSDSWKQRFGSDKWQSIMNYTYHTSAFSMLKFIYATQNSFGFTALENTVSGSSPLPNPQILTNVSILNGNGFAVDMSIKNVVATLKTLPKQNFSNIDVLAYLVKNSVSTTYPFLYFEYIVINRTMLQNNSVSCCTMVEALGYIDYVLDYAKSTSATKYGFINLQSELVQYIRASVLPLISCNGSSVYSDLQQSRTIMVTQVAVIDTWQIIVPIVVAAVALMIFFIGGYIYYKKRVRQGNEDLWKIDESEIILIDVKHKVGLSEVSLNTYQSSEASTRNQMTVNNCMTRIGTFKRNDIVVALTELKFENFSDWRHTTKRLVYKFTRDFNHQNLCLLLGVTTIQRKACLVSQSCRKGTLNSFLENCPFELLLDIKYSLVNNIHSGLNYLHSKLIVHGSLSSLTCFVDDTWCVKISDWALFSITSNEPSKPKPNTTTRTETNGTILSIEDSESLSELIKVLYSDPDLDSMYPSQPTKASDIYSFGMLLLEIFTRQLPYNEEVEMSQTSYLEIIRKKLKKVECLPRMPKEVPNVIRPLILKMVGATENRPDTATVATEITKLCGSSNKNVVDVMMKLMEKHMEDLEDKVVERTSELTSITNRMKDLLNEMLPPQIAEKFIMGATVEPEFYECATIFFSDIVGFTTISARSTPYQVMNLLNSLWKLFDATIEKFDVYKVDTIGDAYMVASGLPVRNGVDHCVHVANFALFLLHNSKTFPISHLPGEALRIRMGINSGPVTAGIVGHKMPQYCIFGDAVNTASRMESSSLPMKIHVSEFSHSLFESYFPEFIFESRGEIEIKGKGTMKTYWLVDSFKPINKGI